MMVYTSSPPGDVKHKFIVLFSLTKMQTAWRPHMDFWDRMEFSHSVEPLVLFHTVLMWMPGRICYQKENDYY